MHFFKLTEPSLSQGFPLKVQQNHPQYSTNGVTSFLEDIYCPDGKKTHTHQDSLDREEEFERRFENFDVQKEFFENPLHPQFKNKVESSRNFGNFGNRTLYENNIQKLTQSFDVRNNRNFFQRKGVATSVKKRRERNLSVDRDFEQQRSKSTLLYQSLIKFISNVRIRKGKYSIEI